MQMHLPLFGDPSGTRTPDPLLKRQSPDSQDLWNPETCCGSSTFLFGMSFAYASGPTAYPIIKDNRKYRICQTFSSRFRRQIIEINYSITFSKREYNMIQTTYFSKTNIFFTSAEASP